MSGLPKLVNALDAAGLARLRGQFRTEPHAIRKFHIALLKRACSDNKAVAELPAILHNQVCLHALKLQQQRHSQVDGATKLLFRTARGMLLESVILRIASGRTTLCISSQVGCAAACDFCATGKMGVAQDLTHFEILDQIVQAGQLLADEGRSIRNIVLMGMGEPFHNEENLYRALEALLAPELFHHPPTRILTSTVGIPAAMVRCARRFPTINQALSLHSVRQDVREHLIPLAKKYSLNDLRDAVVQINRIQHGAAGRQHPTVLIEYLMLAGLNDSDVDAAKLIEWLRPLHVHVNLIPYNPIDGAPQLTGSSRAVRHRFAARLKGAGLPTTIRYSLGADVAAACGQLVQRENRAVAARNAGLASH